MRRGVFRFTVTFFRCVKLSSRNRHCDLIEAGVLAMANDVWDWCEQTGARGRTVTVKFKWADFRLCTRNRSLASPVACREVPRLQPGTDSLRGPAAGSWG